MKKFIMFIAAVIVAVSCSKDNGKDDPVICPSDGQFSGSMIVTSGDVDNVSDNVIVDISFSETEKTMDILLHQVKFVPQMPISLDVTVPGVAYTAANEGGLTFKGENIVPIAGMVGPYPKYTVTSLTGKVSDGQLSMSLKFGDYPVKYVGNLSVK